MPTTFEADGPAPMDAEADAGDANESANVGEELPEIRDIGCDRCGGETFRTLFRKASSRGTEYQLVSCTHCDLVQVNPQPNAAAVAPYYGAEYFTKRTDRGYDNYFSPELKAQIQKVYRQNLDDLGFFEYEEELRSDSWLREHLGASAQPALSGGDRRPAALDLGCAAGYCVQYLAERGWDSRGVELSAAAAEYGIDELGLDIIVDDFLNCAELSANRFDLITLWASIEHMHSPRAALARAYELLRPGGRMILSTCRYGVLAKLRGPEWRFMNVPEHLYFFSLSGLAGLAEEIGFRTHSSVSYGSGFTTKANASWLYRAAKRVADPLVKRLHQGDMMALHLVKPLSA